LVTIGIEEKKKKKRNPRGTDPTQDQITSVQNLMLGVSKVINQLPDVSKFLAAQATLPVWSE
jgi:hypothetical protein